MIPFEPVDPDERPPPPEPRVMVRIGEYEAMRRVCDIAEKAIGFVPFHTTLREDFREAIDALRKVRGL